MDLIKKDIIILFEIKIKDNLFLRFTYTISYHQGDLYDFKELKELIQPVIQKEYTFPEWKTLYKHGKTLYRVRQKYNLEFDSSQTFFYRYEKESFIQMKDKDRIKDYENYQFFMQIENKILNKD
jgi:hypothetical protein